MGLFSKNDWNVIAIIFERKDHFQLNGNRAKGAAAKKTRDGAKDHDRTLYWAVFDQKGSFLEGGPGKASHLIDRIQLTKLIREMPTNTLVRQMLKTLEKKESDKIAKPFQWNAVDKATLSDR